jgi:2-keto-4-pentenoate hydratase
MAVALELNDVSRPPTDAESIIACNVFHRAVILGAPVAGVAPGTLEALLRVNGELRCAAPVDVDPDALLRALAELLLEHSECLEPGDRVITGGLTHVPVSPGDQVRAEINTLGGVEVEITP